MVQWANFSQEKEWSTDAYYNIDRPWTDDAKWKKPDTKVHMLYDSLLY